MTLIGFLKEPYTCVENKTYLESHFNNLRPSQLLIELADCSLSLLEHFKQDRKSLVIDMNLKYNMEKFGDLVNGPGRSVNEIDIFFRLLFENKQTLQI